VVTSSMKWFDDAREYGFVKPDGWRGRSRLSCVWCG